MNEFQQLIRLCSSAVRDPDYRAEHELEVDGLARLAQMHGLSSLLYQSVKHLKVDAPWFHALKKEHERYISLHLLNEGYYDEVTIAFGEAYESGELQYCPIVLKGAHQRRTIYERVPWARPMNDLDLLIHPKDQQRAHKLMSLLEFDRCSSPGPGYHRRMTHAHTWARHVSSRHTVLVDLHCRLTHAMRHQGHAELLHRKAIKISKSLPVWGLSLDHQIAHLALHLGHGFFRNGARSLMDLDLLLDTNEAHEIDIKDPVVKSARSNIYLALRALNRLDQHQTLRPSTLKASALRKLFPTDALFTPANGASGTFNNLLRALAIMDDPKRVIAYPGYLASVQLARRFNI